MAANVFRASKSMRETARVKTEERERRGNGLVILYNLSSEVTSNTPAIFYSLECHSVQPTLRGGTAQGHDLLEVRSLGSVLEAAYHIH